MKTKTDRFRPTKKDIAQAERQLSILRQSLEDLMSQNRAFTEVLQKDRVQAQFDSERIYDLERNLVIAKGLAVSVVHSTTGPLREQLRRFMLLTQDPSTAWQVTAEDWENHRRYDEYVAAVRDMLASTNKPCAPWAVVDATDREVRKYSVCRAMIDRLEQTLDVPATTWPSLEELAASGAEAAAKAPKQPKPPKPAKDKAKDKAAALDAGEEPKDADEKKKKKKDKDKNKKKKYQQLDTPASSADGGVGFEASAAGADEAVDSGGMATAGGGTYA